MTAPTAGRAAGPVIDAPPGTGPATEPVTEPATVPVSRVAHRIAGLDRGGVGVLTIYLVLLFVIPARLAVGPAGTPASLFGLVMLALWTLGRLLGAPRASGLAPVQRLGAAFLFAMLASYVAATLRAAPGGEINAADRFVLFTLSSLGVLTYSCDALRDTDQVDRVVGRMVNFTAALAVVGIFQFFTGFDITTLLQIPGLTATAPLESLLERDEFNRPSATATHPIEFAVVLAMAFPLALARAFYPAPRHDRRRWFAVLAIAVALPMSLSRSGIVGLVVAGVVLLRGWPRSRVLRALLITPIFVVAMRLMVPGLIGTLRNLFTSIGSDSSTRSRTDASNTALNLFTDNPVFGRGMGTFLPSNYVILDNQWLLTLVDMGAVGLAVILSLFGAAFFSARRARDLTDDPRVRELGLALSASVAAIVVAFATFDAFSFPMAAETAFLIVGCCGAVLRIQRERAQDAGEKTTSTQ
ncbi:O-antigen ligase family protein [Frankia sp. CNm7]|uniref:O-antigen ligase family protein n=1 Tax=Frankia nepalensis TaxID=1836974 RepID=A0A937RIC7_9ACTN|nr:O-antigen ligase family protein [Frankia nepalensis]MBL7501229.1 O-antigen ligase family protein [Frankia nepalensis]MBL7512777.1 O-antigen ligase family protein [Frankia nepalensis]MBL7521352.1 O-antigen ligase family protein [Frankia nepalensis]MBL7629515.1 O-antigen ligase family protein [Frankia nepalensis]